MSGMFIQVSVAIDNKGLNVLPNASYNTQCLYSGAMILYMTFG